MTATEEGGVRAVRFLNKPAAFCPGEREPEWGPASFVTWAKYDDLIGTVLGTVVSYRANVVAISILSRGCSCRCVCSTIVRSSNIFRLDRVSRSRDDSPSREVGQEKQATVNKNAVLICE